MTVLTPPQRRALRAKAHHLQPVVSIGQHGLTPGVLHEINVNLKAHELIKVRVFNEDRVRREEMLERICVELDAAPVQHLGKLLIVWRPAPEQPKPKAAHSLPRSGEADAVRERRPGRRSIPKAAQAAKQGPRAQRGDASARESPRRPTRGPFQPPQSKEAAGPMAKSTPQARRPRTPMARVPARPPRQNLRGTPSAANPPTSGSRRRRRGSN